jgi:hypothetical protein
MTPFEKAVKMASSGEPRYLPTLLTEFLEEGSIESLAATQKLFEDDYDGLTFNSELKMTAACYLLAWGERGLDAIFEAALRTCTFKNSSIALEVFASVASGERLHGLQWVYTSEQVKAVMASITNWPSLAIVAKRHLRAFILSLPTLDDAALAVSGALSFLSLTGSEALKELFVAISARGVAIGTPILKAYTDLICLSPIDETRFQAFFERHPQLLDPMAFQVWPRPDLHGAKEPDFVIRRTDNSYLVVEIEVPGKSVVTAGNQLSAQATQAVTQALSYKAFLMERFPEAAQTFPGFREPECLVLIGLEGELNDEQRTALLRENQHRSGLKIVGFDWIAKRAEAISQNIIESRVDVQRIRMV